MQDLLPPAIWSLELAILVLTLASIGYVFSRLGQPGWAVVVPIYGLVVFMRVGHPDGNTGGLFVTLMMLGLFFVPGLNVLLVLGLCIGLARKTKRGNVFGVGLFVLPFLFWPLLAWLLRGKVVMA